MLAAIDVGGLIDWHQRYPRSCPYAALSVCLVVSKSAKGRVKKNEQPLPNGLSAQIVPP
jgi:hypothetical protein